MRSSARHTYYTMISRALLCEKLDYIVMERFMFTKRVFYLVTLSLILVLGVSLASAQEPVTLRILTHWGEERLLTAQEALYGACEAQTGVKAELETVPFGDLLTKIVANNTAGTNTDIIHLYNLWLPDFARSGLLVAPSQEIVDAITANAPEGVIVGITSGGQVWGWPTEVNTYLLIYNKRLLEEAGYSAPPTTWDELKEMAAAISKKDDTGAVTQVGYGIITGWDSGVVHPWATLLMSNGGQYLTDDMTATAFNSPQGVETLQLYADLVANGGSDVSVAAQSEFENGHVGMMIMANWWRAGLQNVAGVDYDTEVGVAPVPVGPSGTETATMSYNWLWGVTASSPNQDKAWEFIQCLNTATAEGAGSPMGNYLVNDLGAIPSMISDQEAFQEDLSDHFLAPFVASVAYARPEPVVAGGQEVKTKLQAEIEAVLNGMEDPATALEFASQEGDSVLQDMAQ
jgi:multiple sugar transport system substrate-binding protein